MRPRSCRSPRMAPCSWSSSSAHRSARSSPRYPRGCSTSRARTRSRAPPASCWKKPATGTRPSNSSEGSTARPAPATNTCTCSSLGPLPSLSGNPKRASSCYDYPSIRSTRPQERVRIATPRRRSPCCWPAAGERSQRGMEGPALKIGIPTEVKDNESRVAATPEGVRELTRAGHTVSVQSGAGRGSAIGDDDYSQAGALIVPDADAVFDADLIVKVKEPQTQEYPRFRRGQILLTYLHLAADRALTESLCASWVNSVAYETVQTPDGRLPLLAPMSEIAGRMAPHVGAGCLERPKGGRGVLMGGASGVAPARVVVLGAGIAG